VAAPQAELEGFISSGSRLLLSVMRPVAAGHRGRNNNARPEPGIVRNIFLIHPNG
jgi:hypothetical protein